ncbi:uncharacterized protein [Linepithema humile]|uniref:uncharacterized protein n=1 Tax=Linepithema humile TaxID=83485 RepID=UPI00351EE57B
MYLLLRITDGWITNNNGDFYVEDTEQKCRIWVPNNLIGFNQNNEPYFKNQENNNTKKPIKIIDISHEFKEKNVSEVDNLDENSIQFEGTNSVNTDENLVQFEETSVNENLHSTKTKEKKNTWSVDETRALIGAIEARYDDMYHVHKRKTFWSIISEELGSQNIEFSELACKKNGLI